MDLHRERMHGLRLSRHDLDGPAEVVSALGAVQAQDLAGGMWAIGARLQGATLADVEAAVARFEIVRTWPMRGTLHFVAAGDVRWMLHHLTPRVRARAKSRYAQLGLDAATFTKAEQILTKALAGRGLARPEAMAALENGGVSPDGQRGIHIIGELAQRGLICGGPLVGKQHSFVLLDEHVPAGKMIDREELLADLAQRFFETHGPATDRDFAWWAGLTLTEARAAMGDLVKPKGARAKVPPALLLPPWDEYTVAYVERSAILDPRCTKATKVDMLRPVVVIDGLVSGTWTRTLTKKGVDVHINPLRKLTSAEERAIESAKERYAAFLGRPLA